MFVIVPTIQFWDCIDFTVCSKTKPYFFPQVILAALTTFEGLVDSLGEDYLQPLLADTMPYITEVLENVDDDVEEVSRNVFSKMESILGDNLRAYLNE